MDIKQKKRRIWIAVISLLLVVQLVTIFMLKETRETGEKQVVEETPVEVVYEAKWRVEELLAMMTLEEKVGQMLQVERGGITPQQVAQYGIGSVLSGGGSAPPNNTPAGWAQMRDDFQEAALSTRLAIPILYGVDAVHGHNNVPGATIFPHNIGLGASRDIELAQRIGAVVAKEVRATGLDWNFAPCVCVPQDERWGRTYEGFSEEPGLVAEFGAAFVRGYQEAETPVLATLKHWGGDGSTTGGVDQGDVALSEAELLRFLEPYRVGIEAGAKTVMVSFSSWKGLKTHGDRYLITDVLKEQFGFEGIVISDYNGVDQVHADYREAIKMSVNAGMDMIMVAGTWEPLYKELLSLAESGEIPITRIDDAVARILRVKEQAGVFQQPFANKELVKAEVVGSTEHRELAREAVRKSLVLLKNDQELLPLAKNKKIFVAGARADDIGVQSGGWTMTWQGARGRITEGTTILEGIEQAVGEAGEVTFSANGRGAKGHDAAIVVVGEDPYAEMHGDRTELTLDRSDLAVIAAVKATGVPTTVVLLSGRPMIVTDVIEEVDAFVAAWLPGTEGAGVADVLFGDYPFTGKLSFTWPKAMSQIPINIGDKPYEPLFEFGFGLTSP